MEDGVPIAGYPDFTNKIYLNQVSKWWAAIHAGKKCSVKRAGPSPGLSKTQNVPK